MIAYRPAAYPRLSQALVAPAPSVMVPAAPIVGSTGPAGSQMPQGILFTALAGAASYAAIQTGIREKGFVKYVGWAGGIAAGLAALVGVGALLSPSTGASFPIRWYYS